jgi:hypothetical protein
MSTAISSATIIWMPMLMTTYSTVRSRLCQNVGSANMAV